MHKSCSKPGSVYLCLIILHAIGFTYFVCCSDNFDVEVIETEGDLEPVEKSKLEESCILVELDKLNCVSLETKTHKSYKVVFHSIYYFYSLVCIHVMTEISLQKKICEALSSKLRSTGKQDQHVCQFKDLGLEAGVITPDSDKRKPLCESEWELL